MRTMTICWNESENGLLEIPISRIIDVPLKTGEMVRVAIHRNPNFSVFGNKESKNSWQGSFVESGTKASLYFDSTRDDAESNTRSRVARIPYDKYRQVTDDAMRKNVDHCREAGEANSHLMNLKLKPTSGANS